MLSYIDQPENQPYKKQNTEKYKTWHNPIVGSVRFFIFLIILLLLSLMPQLLGLACIYDSNNISS